MKVELLAKVRINRKEYVIYVINSNKIFFAKINDNGINNLKLNDEEFYDLLELYKTLLINEKTHIKLLKSILIEIYMIYILILRPKIIFGKMYIILM